MKTLAFALSLFVMVPAMSSQLLFDCQTPVDPFNPDFQQGSETFLYIEVDSTNSLTLKTAKFGTPETPLFGGLSSPFHLGEGSSSLTARFETGYLSMVYLGVASDQNKWGAFVKDGETEEEFFCFEKRDILSL
jgi:hypothetical protein